MSLTDNLPVQKTIRFKVVKAASRYSCMINGNTKYALKYNRGETVTAIPYTFGVMCFDTYNNAYKLIHQHYYYRDNCIIIKVRPRGRGKRVRFLGPPSRLDAFYEELEKPLKRGEYRREFRTLTVPEGTICYPAVDVLT